MRLSLRLPFLFVALLSGIALFPLVTVAQEARSGQTLYDQLCATCHGDDLTGGTGSSLVDGEWMFGGTREEIVHTIMTGLEERGMPGFAAALDAEEADRIVAYIRSVESGTAAPAPPPPDSLETLDYALEAEVVAHDLEEPWAIDFIDERTALVTEKPGRLRVVEDGRLRPEPVAGTPAVVDAGQGGLLDVAVDPQYGETGWIYLAYSHALDGGGRAPAMTRVVRGRLDGNTWTDQEVVFEAPHDTYLTTRHHYGSRIVFGPEGHLYFAIGDRGAKEQAQDLARPNGKIHRLHRDGSIPEDNPFVGREDALPSIYTYGHRNPQGLAIHPETGELWAVEHGPRGGDELNRIVAGRNYGWPVITYGINYDGTTITTQREHEGMEQPVLYWRPSIAVSGLDFYDGNRFPYWQNELLVGALKFEEVRVLNVEDGRVMHQEVILNDEGRVREAVTGPDGAVYVVLNQPGMVVRLVPRGES